MVTRAVPEEALAIDDKLVWAWQIARLVGLGAVVTVVSWGGCDCGQVTLGTCPQCLSGSS